MVTSCLPHNHDHDDHALVGCDGFRRRWQKHCSALSTWQARPIPQYMRYGHIGTVPVPYRVLQRQTAVTAYFSSKQLLLFAFAVLLFMFFRISQPIPALSATTITLLKLFFTSFLHSDTLKTRIYQGERFST